MRDNWTLQVRSRSTGGDRFFVSGAFKHKGDFDDFIACLRILETLADDAPSEPTAVVLGGADALAALCPA